VCMFRSTPALQGTGRLGLLCGDGKLDMRATAGTGAGAAQWNVNLLEAHKNRSSTELC
jgi:hypothetical protein